MKWSDLPETTIKKGMKAEFDGVLVPELNYRNYRTLDDLAPELNKLMKGNDVIFCDDTTIWESPILWAVVGVFVGGFVVKVMR